MMAGMPVNRFHSFERMFFKNDIPVLQGITLIAFRLAGS